MLLLSWILSPPQLILENLNIINSMIIPDLSDFHTPSLTKLLKNPTLAAYIMAISPLPPTWPAPCLNIPQLNSLHGSISIHFSLFPWFLVSMLEEQLQYNNCCCCITNLVYWVNNNFPQLYLGSAVTLLGVLHHVLPFAPIIMISSGCLKTTSKNFHNNKIKIK